jgi:hypothetical protein
MADINALSVSIVKSAVERELDREHMPDVRELALMCFAESRRQRSAWLLSTDDERFRVGLNVLYLFVDDDTKRRIESEVGVLKALNAAASGVPIDFETVFEGVDPDNVIGLQKLFEESKSRVQPFEL